MILKFDEPTELIETDSLSREEKKLLAFFEELFSSHETPQVASVVRTGQQYKIISSRKFLRVGVWHDDRIWLYSDLSKVDEYLDYLYANDVYDYTSLKFSGYHLEAMMKALMLKKSLIASVGGEKEELLRLMSPEADAYLFMNRNMFKKTLTPQLLAKMVENKEEELKRMNNIPNLKSLYLDFRNDPRPKMKEKIFEYKD